MDKNNTFDAMKSSGEFSWINSDLYNMEQNDQSIKNDNDDSYTKYQNKLLVKKHKHSEFNKLPTNKVTQKTYQKGVSIKSRPKTHLAQESSNMMGEGSVSACTSTFSKVLALSASNKSERCFITNLFIETKSSHWGPLPFKVYPKMNLQLSKLQVEKEFGIPASSQKWIINNMLALTGDTTLSDYGVTPTSSIFLYVDSNFDKDINISAILSKPPTIKLNKHSLAENFTPIKQSFMHPSKEKIMSASKITDNYSNKEAMSGASTSGLNFSNKSNEIKKAIVSKQVLDMNKYNSSYDPTSKMDAKCKNLRIKSFKDPKRTVFSDAKYVSKACYQVSSEKVMHSSSSDVSEKSSTESNYAKGNYFNNSNNKNIAPVISDSIHKTAKESISKKLESIVNLKKIHQSSARVYDSSKCNEPESSNCDKAVPNTKKLFLHQLKLKQQAKIAGDCVKVFKLNMENHKEHENLFGNRQNYGPSSAISQNLTSDTLNNMQVFERSDIEIKKKAFDKLICEKVSHDVVEKEDNNEIQNSIENSVLTVGEISSSSCDSNVINHVTNELLIAEISIQNVTDDVSLENSPNSMINDDQENQNEIAYMQNEESAKNYQFLLDMENLNLVRNIVNFTCPVCFGEFESDQGVVLHECLHTFCLDCLRSVIEFAEEAEVKCPYRDEMYSCDHHLQQREIKALVPPDVYERYLQRSVTTAESLADKSFHCKTPDCPGWCMIEDSINVFQCPVCGHYNCLNCMAIHEGLNCRQYQDMLVQKKKVDPDSEKTLQFLDRMIESGKAVKCPKCDLVLMKKWGCDWLKCSVCLTEICWITRGPRWGPGGQGDTSGGCRCGVNGVKCHPSCTYCH
ncbi:hypothetical protein JTE90_001786 [Oedothorax gibbosus]|uniref:RanBP-type and C3HC4-type zinc finger-containing protein 1 n=1 Tax=Oedothorax gibbosus TaxID=931172 RepID=A0AAV6VU45_9ARAC|nr:hypothetical protein JTE90_001786 [Oedothorax gibbosus]